MPTTNKISNKGVFDAPVTRRPTAEDGPALYKIAQASNNLDVNTEYAYLLLGAHFSESCAVVEKNGTVEGFTSAYLIPGSPDTLFVWQIAIDKAHRKKGLAKIMLKDILCRKICDSVRYLHATVTPTNVSSRKLFESLARDLGSEIKTLPFFEKHLFSGDHEEELLKIGPFNPKHLPENTQQ